MVKIYRKLPVALVWLQKYVSISGTLDKYDISQCLFEHVINFNCRVFDCDTVWLFDSMFHMWFLYHQTTQKYISKVADTKWSVKSSQTKMSGILIIGLFVFQPCITNGRMESTTFMWPPIFRWTSVIDDQPELQVVSVGTVGYKRVWNEPIPKNLTVFEFQKYYNKNFMGGLYINL